MFFFFRMFSCSTGQVFIGIFFCTLVSLNLFGFRVKGVAVFYISDD